MKVEGCTLLGGTWRLDCIDISTHALTHSSHLIPALTTLFSYDYTLSLSLSSFIL